MGQVKPAGMIDHIASRAVISEAVQPKQVHRPDSYITARGQPTKGDRGVVVAPKKNKPPPADLAIVDVKVDKGQQRITYGINGLPHPKNILRAKIHVELLDANGNRVAQSMSSYDQYTGGQRDKDHFSIGHLRLKLPKNAKGPLTIKLTTIGLYEGRDKKLDSYTYKTETMVPYKN